ncbi:MAG: transcription antitermination factor NusB [Lachnospiraceae bacterium]|nr:transcription antitermination factor NusB [Lachnospiraceae bacterium]
MKRSALREQIFLLLFRVEFNSADQMQAQEDLFFTENDAAGQIREEDESYIRSKYENIVGRLADIDAEINERTVGWETERMSKVDLTIIRLAVYEILFDESVPTGVAINEAVELAKRYGQDESPSFVNGVLAKFA